MPPISGSRAVEESGPGTRTSRGAADLTGAAGPSMTDPTPRVQCPTTRWSRVVAASDRASPEARGALAGLWS